MKVYLISDKYRIEYEEYLGGCDTSDVLITNGSYESTFIVSGISADISSEDKKEFEDKFNCKILFFLKSNKTNMLTPRVVVKAAREIRDKLTSMRCFFQSMEDVSNGDIGLSAVLAKKFDVRSVLDIITVVNVTNKKDNGVIADKKDTVPFREHVQHSKTKAWGQSIRNISNSTESA
ncbi:hypothetical protein ACOME3_006695 [Neoechinorhynchus agilis]